MVVTTIGVLRLVLRVDSAYSSVISVGIIMVVCLPAEDFSFLGSLQPNVRWVQVFCVTPGKEIRGEADH